jgi:hypothetical protein
LSNKNVYFSVDSGREALISGFRVLSSFQGDRAVDGLRNIIIESSIDGVIFTKEESFKLKKVDDTGVISMATPFNSRYFRFYVENSAWYSGRLSFGQIEVFQTQPRTQPGDIN